jgi:ATP-dependent Clp protease adaptor protein ClpS
MARPDAPGGDAGTAIVQEPRAKERLQRPQLWRVLLHNDHYTTMEFVVAILMAIFHKNEADATAVMLHVHQRGVGVAGVYTKEIAEAKVQEVMHAAEQAEFPLLCTCEPEADPEESE